jgi:hypothetical protein
MNFDLEGTLLTIFFEAIHFLTKRDFGKTKISHCVGNDLMAFERKAADFLQK